MIAWSHVSVVAPALTETWRPWRSIHFGPGLAVFQISYSVLILSGILAAISSETHHAQTRYHHRWFDSPCCPTIRRFGQGRDNKRYALAIGNHQLRGGGGSAAALQPRAAAPTRPHVPLGLLPMPLEPPQVVSQVHLNCRLRLWPARCCRAYVLNGLLAHIRPRTNAPGVTPCRGAQRRSATRCCASCTGCCSSSQLHASRCACG